MQLKYILTALATLAPLASSTYVGNSSSASCKDNEFWWSDKKCCLPKGGSSKPPPPPKEINCPPTSYYWGEKQGCCVPRNPPPSNSPPPQCPNGWTWYPSLWRCHPTPTPPTSTPSKPSGKPGYENPGNHGGPGRYHKRSLTSRVTLCPTGLDACPISSGLSNDYECVDTSSELESCGGCTSLGQGQDCKAIPGAWDVGCEQGSCVVYTCAGGFHLAPDGHSCIPH